jgi:hypothetical protein
MPHKTVSERRGLITAEDRLRSQASHAIFMVDKMELGQVSRPPQYFALTVRLLILPSSIQQDF